MAKYLLLLFNASILSIFSFFIDGDVSIEMNVPGNIQPGDEFTVELVIEKTNVDGFAKIQLELPDGLEAIEGDSHTGKFDFIDQKVKILFWNLPPEDKFTITFTVKVSPSFTDEINLNGKLSYIIDNERKEVEFSQNTTEGNPSNEGNTDPVTDPVVAPVTDPNTDPVTNTDSATNTPDISASRTINTNQIDAGEELTVTIQINKGDLGGFAKIQDIIPAGFEAKEGESNGGKFSVLDTKVKILWMNLPSEPEFTITYKLIAKNGVSGDFNLDQGIFSYVLPEASGAQELQLESSSFNVKTEQVAAVDPDPVDENSNGDENKNDEEKNNTQDLPKIEKPNVEPVKGINYRVQICATHTQVDASYFVKNHNVTEEIFMELHEGWTKFTVGNFSYYQQARDHRETVRTNNNIVGPFVTAYNDGTRITVQQALMLSQQKWVP